jgi:general secretion pathway protein D
VVRNPDGTTTTTTGISPDLIEQGAAALAGITGGVAGIGFRAGDALFGAILNAVRSTIRRTCCRSRRPSRSTIRRRASWSGRRSDHHRRGAEPQFRQCVPHRAAAECRHHAAGAAADQCGGAIKMDLRVEVSSIAGPAAARSQDFILNKRESENTLVVEDGEIA